MLRWDIIEAAGTMQNILFPIFTNGTYMNERYLKLFDKCRNLIPVMSIEGGKEITDERRGEGVYNKLIANMDALHERSLLFGASVTVTTENIREVTSPEFLRVLTERGCKLVIYVEFVPVTDEARHLAPGDKERTYLMSAMDELRKVVPDTLLLAFPGDERADGGCMAAGRGRVRSRRTRTSTCANRACARRCTRACSSSCARAIFSTMTTSGAAYCLKSVSWWRPC